MPLLALALLIVVPLALVALFPLLLLQRYRAGSARRLARPWVATINVVAILVSATFLLIAAAITNVWVTDALRYAVAGLAAGCVLGVIGLWLTRWEPTPRTLHYTPNRWLVFAITLVVLLRVLYGYWRGWTAWRSTADDTSFIAALGIAGSLGAGATVVGYYLAYAVGLRARIGKWQRRKLRALQ